MTGVDAGLTILSAAIAGLTILSAAIAGVIRPNEAHREDGEIVSHADPSRNPDSGTDRGTA